MVVDLVIIGMADTMMLLIGYDGHKTDAVCAILGADCIAFVGDP